MNALPRLGIVQQQPREFQLVGKSAAIFLTGRRDARLAGGKRRGRKAGNAADNLGGALRQLDARHCPMHHAKLARRSTIEYFGAENERWINYMLKNRQKSEFDGFLDCIIIESLHNPIADA